MTLKSYVSNSTVPLFRNSDNQITFKQKSRSLYFPVFSGNASSRQNTTSVSFQCRSTKDENHAETSLYGALKDALSAFSKLTPKSQVSGFISSLYLESHRTKPMNIVSSILGSDGSNELTPPAVLLHGPARTGKTSLVHALAKQANVTFISVTGEDLTQDEKGNGRLKSIFSEARVGAPSIIFIHGVEAVKAVTQLVQEIIRCKKDGFVVIIVATTVNADRVSPKLMKRITVECCLQKPDLETRIKMAEVLLKNLNVVEEDRETIHNYLAYETSGFVWSDLELVCDNSLALAKYQGDVAVLVTKEHVSESLTAVKALHVLRNASKE